MPNRDDILWFKTQFQAQIEPRLHGTPLTVDFIAAIACQESGEIWPVLRQDKDLDISRILALCVGDTLDADKGRSAFPKTRDALTAKPDGEAMFKIAHQALADMAKHVRDYQRVAAKPDKFCHGFGIFQRDLQFFLDDPAFFLDRDYEHFDKALDKCLEEIKRGLRTLGFEKRPSLSDMEFAALGIAYNTGGFKPKKGLRQGHFNGSKYYGESLYEYLQLAHTVALPGEQPGILPPNPGEALVPPPTAVTATGPFYRVDTREGMLRLRSEPRISEPPRANVIAGLPDGHGVRALTGVPENNFMEVETSLAGAFLRGFASTRFLVPAPDLAGIPPVDKPVVAIPPVSMPRRPGTVTRREDEANAHSLNEDGQPGRAGATPDELRAELAAIIEWLGVDTPEHKRYQPARGLTFCNIYAHDYCHLAGVYLPRVWWTGKALVALGAGKAVAPLIGDTIAEMRANDLFRWLRDFGPGFGWRQTGTLTKLQTAVNQGAIGLIVARRKEDGRSGHIVAVVPETDELQARRNAAGEVTSPLQSQAGSRNFSYGTGAANWWKGEQFAESAFWLHA